MKLTFYPKLAWEGIRKNKRLYTPYILTCSGMVMMFYIIHYLAAMPTLKEMPGGDSTTMMLGFGTWIVALFALIFLFYTNSFLIRRRQKEFGLYNILGMGKGNLSMLLLLETVILFCISMTVGLACGILFSKLAELGLIRALGGEITYDFTINADAFVDTFVIFVPIFCLIFLKSLWQMWRMSAVSLLRSENAGEKPPKANYLLGIGGILILAGAYYIAVSIQSPLVTMIWFFIAVGMVIVATYMLFISGSVMLCKLLQKNKRYYYQKNHFVSVSSMVYRMKRNGAGLASICILSTMVLVMMLGAGSLYFGAEDSLHTRYPSDINLTVDYLTGTSEVGYTAEKVDLLIAEVDDVIDSFGVEPQNVQRYLSTSVTAMLKDGKLIADKNTVDTADVNTMDFVCAVYFVPLEDYNRCMGADETLGENQVLLHCVRRTYKDPTITMIDGTVLEIKNQLDDFMGSGDAAMNMLPTVFVVVNDLESIIDAINMELANLGEAYLCRPELMYSFDVDMKADEEIKLADSIRERIRELDISGKGGFYSSSVECREAKRDDFYGTYGGIFYLGIILSIVFLLATVLIIYYKQITEGYEDEGRFEIMRKVGMTTKDIRQSINSQMLTVFFLPLITAVLHLSFAFPIVKKLLALFNLRNTPLMLTIMVVAVLVFGVFYALIYRVTSNAYFSIVSGVKDD